MFVLFNVLIFSVVAVIDSMAFGRPESFTPNLSSIYLLAVFLPALAVSVRRLHDSGRSGWWVLIGLVPCVGWIILIVFYVLPGTVGNNKFGADPKGQS